MLRHCGEKMFPPQAIQKNPMIVAFCKIVWKPSTWNTRLKERSQFCATCSDNATKANRMTVFLWK